jgi:nicotinamidase-related amidase
MGIVGRLHLTVPDTSSTQHAASAGTKEPAMDPKTTALILVGYQNDYFAPDGILRGVVEEPNRVDEVLAASLAFIERAKSTEMTIISTPIVLEADYRALADPVGILSAIKESGAFEAGTRGADAIPELLAFGDRVLYVTGKVGFNAFSNTMLEDVLADQGIREVLVAGMVTSLCIDSTGRAAYERGYNVTILSDCTSGRTPGEQEFYCKNIFPLYGGVASSRAITFGSPLMA